MTSTVGASAHGWPRAAAAAAMGLITGSLFLGGLALTAPLWFPLLLLCICAPHVMIVVVGGLALVTSPIWIPLALLSVPVVVLLHPIILPIILAIILL
ncbi:hypothetical protein TSOC_003413 [Tetrabaena socialis]|uniref:Uncharacterized protein n=1 Tax=Tetrabaena socialis TaxID=47790 RepID=A0A2J8ABN5_9CHLO|nr:hypothetical protein TSOC_003413 [Tetrabaena socialis]|eukprot:PNH09938.1 hypothetical protein TSOC_003413 [Tetrabaena socialis]